MPTEKFWMPRKKSGQLLATGLPQIDGTVGYQNSIKQPVTLIPSEIAGGPPGAFIP